MKVFSGATGSQTSGRIKVEDLSQSRGSEIAMLVRGITGGTVRLKVAEDETSPAVLPRSDAEFTAAGADAFRLPHDWWIEIELDAVTGATDVVIGGN